MRRAFSIIEVLFAVGFLASALLVLVHLFSASLAQAGEVAQKYDLEAIMRSIEYEVLQTPVPYLENELPLGVQVQAYVFRALNSQRWELHRRQRPDIRALQLRVQLCRMPTQQERLCLIHVTFDFNEIGVGGLTIPIARVY